MAGDAPLQRMTVDEYLAREATATEKHEFLDGQAYAMSGGTIEHSQLIVGVISELRQALRGGPCRVYDGNLRVKSMTTGLYTYPDATIACGKAQLEGDAGTTLLSPRVIFEVLSPSTEAYDRGEKFAHYRTIPSLDEYVLVSTSKPRVEIFARSGDHWELRVFEAGGLVEITSVGAKIAVDAIYEGIELTTATREPAAG